MTVHIVGFLGLVRRSNWSVRGVILVIAVTTTFAVSMVAAVVFVMVVMMGI